MKNDDIRINKEFENELKNKMDSLSSSVNCFDKISARAFSESDTDYEMVVSDVENVSGRFRATPVMKIAAVAAAAAACIAFIPRTSAFQSFLANINETPKKEFRSLIKEIEDETGTNTYRVYDMMLDDYARYDLMYNPLSKCPFMINEGDEEARVRLFVRTYNDIPTNQMYAIEYSGEYNNSNFIAAAETGVTFTEEELEAVGSTDTGEAEFLSELELSQKDLSNIIENNFYCNRYGNIAAENGVELTVASYFYDNIFKTDDHVKRYPCQIVYFKEYEGSEYYYDICIENVQKISWERSLYTDDTSAMPIDEADDISVFRQLSLAKPNENNDRAEVKFGYYEPYNSYESIAPDDGLNTFEIGYNALVNFVAPVSKECKRAMRIYIPNFNFMMYSSQSDPTINITIAETGRSFRIHDSDLKGSNMMHTHVDVLLENYHNTEVFVDPDYILPIPKDSYIDKKIYFSDEGIEAFTISYDH